MTAAAVAIGGESCQQEHGVLVAARFPAAVDRIHTIDLTGSGIM